jgi:hypothetical protein
VKPDGKKKNRLDSQPSKSLIQHSQAVTQIVDAAGREAFSLPVSWDPVLGFQTAVIVCGLVSS